MKLGKTIDAEVVDRFPIGEPFPWAVRAACSPHNRSNDVYHLYFSPPKRESRSQLLKRYAAARAICETCPVRQDCAESRMAEGIWSGDSHKSAEHREARI